MKVLNSGNSIVLDHGAIRKGLANFEHATKAQIRRALKRSLKAAALRMQNLVIKDIRRKHKFSVSGLKSRITARLNQLNDHEAIVWAGTRPIPAMLLVGSLRKSSDGVSKGGRRFSGAFRAFHKSAPHKDGIWRRKYDGEKERRLRRQGKRVLQLIKLDVEDVFPGVL